MLMQNWFCEERFLMVEDGFGIQIFYDKDNKCFYYVEENERGNVTIEEFQPESDGYNNAMFAYEQIIKEGGLQ